MRLYQIWHLNGDPTDAAAPYTPYTFGTGNMQLDMGIARRQSVTTIPGVDGVADGYGARAGPLDDRTLTYTCLVPTAGGPEAARDRLMAAIMGTRKVRLVALADDNTTLWFTTAKLVRLDLMLDSEQAFRFTFKAQWRIRPYWTPRYSEAADIWGLNDGVWGTSDGLWGQGLSTQLTTNPTVVSIDATGVAGTTLPTLPDTGPHLRLSGPFGGDGGIIIANNNATWTDAGGVEQVYELGLPAKMLSTNDGYDLDCAAQKFTGGGVPFRPSKASAAQPSFFKIVPGVVNTITVNCFGANPVTGGYISIDWFRRRA